LWHGIVLEEQELIPNEAAIRLVKQLDERGILQTIVSKNDHDVAWKALSKMGLADYFLVPAINWGQKSENLRQVAQKLNIDLDAFAVIDDSVFERNEISVSTPQVRVYAETDIDTLLTRDEFDVTITEISRVRRLSYKLEHEREQIRQSFSGNYDDFLRSCEMILEAFTLNNDTGILRCWELVQRSNQLNLSTNRYTYEEFSALVTSPAVLSIGLRCRDKYGDYGIIGFVAVDFSSTIPLLFDMVLSCRVAQKKIEHTFIKHLAQLLTAHRYSEMDAAIVRTARNLPLQQVFKTLPFSVLDDDGTRMRMKLVLQLVQTLDSVMQFGASGVEEFIMKQMLQLKYNVE
jgi:FkbH-like protein